MRSKYTIGVLAFAVLFIWAVVFFRIASPEFSAEPEVPIRKEPEGVVVTSNDSLILSYADPFLKTPHKEIEYVTPEETSEAVVMRPPSISYEGKIKKSGAVNYMIKIEGRSSVVKVGEELEELKLADASADSLFFRYFDATIAIPLR